jgi:autotransporter-associated beta strand protein
MEANGANGIIALTKVGTGTLTLTGPNAYTGLTTVSNGELVVSTVFGGKGNFWVTNAATLGVTNLSGTSALVSNLTVAAGTALEFQNVSSTATPLVLASNVAVGGSRTVKITGTNGLVAGNSYLLIKYAGNLSGAFTNLQLQMPYGWRGTLVNSGNQISLASVAVVSSTQPQLNTTLNGRQLQLQWPFDHIGWRLLMNTNLVSTNWLGVPGAGVTNLMLVSPTNGSVFFRLVYP